MNLIRTWSLPYHSPERWFLADYRRCSLCKHEKRQIGRIVNGNTSDNLQNKKICTYSNMIYSRCTIMYEMIRCGHSRCWEHHSDLIDWRRRARNVLRLRPRLRSSCSMILANRTCHNQEECSLRKGSPLDQWNNRGTEASGLRVPLGAAYNFQSLH